MKNFSCLIIISLQWWIRAKLSCIAVIAELIYQIEWVCQKCLIFQIMKNLPRRLQLKLVRTTCQDSFMPDLDNCVVTTRPYSSSKVEAGLGWFDEINSSRAWNDLARFSATCEPTEAEIRSFKSKKSVWRWINLNCLQNPGSVGRTFVSF